MNFFQCITALHAITLKEIRRFFRVWPQSIISPSINLVLYFIIFKSFSQSLYFSNQNIAYIDFISPGLILMGVISASFDNATLSFFNARFRHTLDDQRISPMSSHLIILGYIFGSLTRAIIVALIALIITLVFTQVTLAHPMIMLMTIVLSSLIFSLIGLIAAFYTEDFDQLTIIPNFILIPLLLFSGIFFSPDQLGHIWQSIYYSNPLTYLVSLIRYSFLDLQAPQVSTIFSICMMSLLLLYYLTFILLKRISR